MNGRLVRIFVSLFAWITVMPAAAFAQNPPPGAIFDTAVAHPGALSSTIYQQFSTSFVADNSSEYVSFAFREVPAYWGFDDACVTASTCAASNLLADPGFEADTPANVLTNFPVGWGRWIQPVDTSAIGVVASNSSTYGCSTGAHSGTYFWCDGSVQGYDALYQQLTGLTPGTTYNISWFMTDNSGQPITYPTIDMLVYAGDALPTGTIPIGSTVPEPSSIVMIGTGLAGLVGAYRARRARRTA